LLGGQVDATFATTGEVGVHVKGGKLRMLAVMADQRLKDFDQVPTFRERSIDVQLGTWRALAAPKATPPEIMASLKSLVDMSIRTPATATSLLVSTSGL
jgi:tripartite-type tricarboxylate transporter receptor subunit TctC